MKQESVLVIPASALDAVGRFQGFTDQVDAYLPSLLQPSQLSFLPRGQAEEDPTFKQLIPYLVLQHGSQVFHYRRGGAGTETRLRALRSIGIGGHICSEDGMAGNGAYERGMDRELAEEVLIETHYAQKIIGLINDDSSPVGQVHLGIVHWLELAEPKLKLRDPALTAGGFAPLATLREQREGFESWSQFLLDALG